MILHQNQGSLLYIMTLTSDNDRFTIPHYGSGVFRTNDTIAMAGSQKTEYMAV